MRRLPVVALALICISAIPLLAQSAPDQSGTPSAPIVRQKPARTTAPKPAAANPKFAAKPESLVPLTDRERALQVLDRFTFGPRPGDVDHVLAMGVDKWFDQQLNPSPAIRALSQ